MSQLAYLLAFGLAFPLRSLLVSLLDFGLVYLLGSP